MKPLNVTLLRKRERDEKQDELKRQETLLNHPKIEDKTQIKKNMAHLNRQLQDFSPDVLLPAERDKLAGLERQLADKIREGMPSDETMRKNPVGAIDQHSAWEKAKKKLILAWKNVRIQLNPDSDDRDLANVERLRSSGQMDRLRTDAQIGGHMSYSHIDEVQWPFGSPENTALEQAKRAEQERQARIAQSVSEAEQAVWQAEVPRVEPPRKRVITPEHKQKLQEALVKARAIRRAKHEAQQTTEAPVSTHADAVASVA